MSAVLLIVPCYNAAAFLSETIESVLRQDLQDWELVLVDDGSRDTTWDVIQRYVALDPRISGFQKPNGGATKARNFGFAKAGTSSRYVIFLDHDDQWEPDALSRMSAYLDAHPDVGLLACQFQELNAAGEKQGVGHRSRWAPGFLMPHDMRDDEIETPFVTFFCATGQGPFAMYRRSVYVQTEGWETSFWPHEDTDMFCQMALLAKVHFLPDRLYLKRVHPDQGMSDGPRVQAAYGKFRAKWNDRQPRNPHEAKLLRDATRYYNGVHKPFRDLKVARLVLGELLRGFTMKQLRFFMWLIGSALQGFLFGRFKTRT